MPALTAFEPLDPQDPRTIGSFRLRARLGSGGMGRVYLGSSPAGRAVAVKVVHPELARDEMFRKRFRREVAAARRVSGAYTAPVIDAGPDDEIPWLATAYVAGPSVADAVATAGPLPPDTVLRLGGGLAEALADIHATDLVHRDLKPSNVLLAADGPRVIDFGISRAFETTVMTTTGVVIGTPAFMSPEQAAGQEAGHATDVFSLGAVLAYAATGRVPFGEGSPVTVLYRVVHAEPDLDGLDGPLRDLIARCLAKDPAVRPTAREVAALTYELAEDSGVPEQAHSFWPAMLDALIRSYADRAAEIPAWLVNTMTVPQAAAAEEPAGRALADADQPVVSDVAAAAGVPANGDAASAADSGRSIATAGESTLLVLAGTSPADATAPPVTAGEGPGPGASRSGAAPGDPRMPPGHGPGARHPGASDGTHRPARSRPPMLSRGALAATLVVLLAACVTAVVTLLPPGGPKAGAHPPLAPGTATSHASSAAASSAATLASATATRHSTVARGTAKPSSSGHTVAPGTPSPGADPTSTVNPAPTPGASQGTHPAPPSSAMGTVSSPPHRSYPVPGLLGAPDWNGYCAAQGLGTAYLTQQNAYGWYCSGSSAGLDGNTVCAWSFNLSTSQVTNTITNFNDPNSWECFTATEQLSPPNWGGYCAAQGLGTATLQPGNAYGWHCKNGSVIDGNSACEWTNGASTLVVSRFQDFYDANSWQCWV